MEQTDTQIDGRARRILRPTRTAAQSYDYNRSEENDCSCLNVNKLVNNGYNLIHFASFLVTVSIYKQQSWNLYGRDGKFRSTLKTGTERNRFSIPLLIARCYQIAQVCPYTFKKFPEVTKSFHASPPPRPHHGLPPCRGGGAYAPMTRTIFNLKERS